MTLWPRAPRGGVPHHGPITPNCPVDCLQVVLSKRSLNLLARAYDAPFDPPQTVRDVVELCQQRKLGQIGGLGRHRISEIRAALVYAGLNIAGNPEPADRKGE